jgi:protein tyrosine phosphatase (PTP) superfamily phosphohydrolase (DUF442 family)
MITVAGRAFSRFPLSMILHGSVLGLVLALAIHFGYVLLGSNFRTVVPGVVYRSAQPTPAMLERIIQKHGIRTVVNLRGCCISAPWYCNEVRVTSALGISQEDLPFSAGRLPSPQALAQLIEVFDRTEYPILLHCHQGADRTGLATVVYFLLQQRTSLAAARRNLGLSSGHLAVGRTGYIDCFFDLYEQWLAEQGLEHSSAVFRCWARDYYCPAVGRVEYSLVRPANDPETGKELHVRPNTQAIVTVRCRNTSIRPWRMQPGPNAGLHADWSLEDEQGQLVVQSCAGLFEATVLPGQSVDLCIPLPALPPGRFQLRVDLFNAQHGSFLQLGNDPLIVDVEVS